MLIDAWWYVPLLAVSVVLYRSIDSRWKQYGLTAMSLLVLAIVSWRSTVGFLVVTAATYVLAAHSRRKKDAPLTSKAAFVAALALNLGYLSLFKYLPAYAPPAAAMLAAFTGGLLLPLGLSYFTFRFLHYAIESRRGTIPVHPFADFLSYASLFSIFPAGPIERFQVLAPQLREPKFDPSDVPEGLRRIVVGSFKKIVVADLIVYTLIESLGRVVEEFDAYSWRSQHARLFGELLYVYFDFAGYSDIAIGTTRLFGLRIGENFNNPLLTTNVSEFWRSWHMSLTSWCRDYIYFPVFGLTRRPKFALFCSMLVLGAWHGTHAGWLVWGAWQAAGLVIWQLWTAEKRKRPAWVRLSNTAAFNVVAWGIALNWVVLGEVWTLYPDLRMSTRYLIEILTLR